MGRNVPISDEDRKFVLDNFRTMTAVTMGKRINRCYETIIKILRETNAYGDYRRVCGKRRVSSRRCSVKQDGSLNVRSGRSRWNTINRISPNSINKLFRQLKNNGYQLHSDKRIAFITTKTTRFLRPEKTLTQHLHWRLRDLRDPEHPKDVIY